MLHIEVSPNQDKKQAMIEEQSLWLFLFFNQYEDFSKIVQLYLGKSLKKWYNIFYIQFYDWRL